MITKTQRLEKVSGYAGKKDSSNYYTMERLVETWWFLFIPIYTRKTITRHNL